MRLRLNESVDIGNFFHDKIGKVFSIDESDLKEHNIFQRIYDDAGDVGFLIENPKTGKTILVTYVDTMDFNGDFSHWIFCPTYEDVSRIQNFLVTRFMFLMIDIHIKSSILIRHD